MKYISYLLLSGMLYLTCVQGSVLMIHVLAVATSLSFYVDGVKFGKTLDK